MENDLWQRARELWKELDRQEQLCETGKYRPREPGTANTYVSAILATLRAAVEAAYLDAAAMCEAEIKRYPEPDHRTTYAEGGVYACAELARRIRARSKP